MKTKDTVIESNVQAGVIRPQKTVDLAGAVVLDLLFTVRDKNGKITEERFEQGHSFVANFIKMLYCTAMIHHAPMVDGVALSLVDTGGTTRAGSSTYAVGNTTYGLGDTTAFNTNAGVGITDYGILVGTDDGTILPKDINNYALGAKIAHGTGTGQLSYGNSSIVAVTHDSATYSYAGITRSFSNASGASIDVNEIGLAAYMNRWDTTTVRYFLMSRDILGTAITVPNAQALTASIRLKCYC